MNVNRIELFRYKQHHQQKNAGQRQPAACRERRQAPQPAGIRLNRTAGSNPRPTVYMEAIRNTCSRFSYITRCLCLRASATNVVNCSSLVPRRGEGTEATGHGQPLPRSTYGHATGPQSASHGTVRSYGTCLIPDHNTIVTQAQLLCLEE